jgi:hypothetical protein
VTRLLAGARFAEAACGADAADVDPPAGPIPVPLWTWSLLRRSDDTRPMIARATRALIDHASAVAWRIPPSEPHWPPTSEKKA